MDEGEGYFCIWVPVRLGRVRTEDASCWTGEQHVHFPRFVQCLAPVGAFTLTTEACTGLGLGSILAKASAVTDTMVEASSLGLARSLTKDEEDEGLVYPRIERIRDISAQIAVDVIRAAQEAGVSRNAELKNYGDEESLKKWVVSKMWNA